MILLGGVADRYGAATMLHTEALLGVAGVGLFIVAAQRIGRTAGRTAESAAESVA